MKVTCSNCSDRIDESEAFQGCGDGLFFCSRECRDYFYDELDKEEA
jgi:hypothetical protein